MTFAVQYVNSRTSHLRCSIKKAVLKNVAIFTGKHLCLSLKDTEAQVFSLHKKSSFPLRISSVNVTKSAVSCGFGHIY